jgi:hypothetical protein
MMTNGPAATVGEILEVNFPRPRSRKQLLEDPEYYQLREQLIGFLEERSHLRPARVAPPTPLGALQVPHRVGGLGDHGVRAGRGGRSGPESQSEARGHQQREGEGEGRTAIGSAHGRSPSVVVVRRFAKI